MKIRVQVKVLTTLLTAVLCYFSTNFYIENLKMTSKLIFFPFEVLIWISEVDIQKSPHKCFYLTDWTENETMLWAIVSSNTYSKNSPIKAWGGSIATINTFVSSFHWTISGLFYENKIILLPIFPSSVSFSAHPVK